MKLRRVDVRDLREKYERMLVLRTAHARARSDRSFVEPNPHQEMRLLAERFPGVLREIDILPIEEIERRVACLSEIQTLANAADDEPWIVAIAFFHRFARGALETKRWLRGRKRVTSQARALFAASCSVDARLFEDDLALITHPPRGRLMDLVFAKLAVALHVNEANARLLVFGVSGRRRA